MVGHVARSIGGSPLDAGGSAPAKVFVRDAPGSYTFTAERGGPHTVYGWGRGAAGFRNFTANASSPGGSSGAAGRKTIDLVEGDRLLVEIDSIGSVTVTGPGINASATAAVRAVNSGVASVPGAASGWDVNLQGSRGGSTASGNPENGQGDGGGQAGSSANNNSQGGGAGAPGFLEAPGGSGTRAINGSAQGDDATSPGAGTGGISGTDTRYIVGVPGTERVLIAFPAATS